jgi:type VI secretion system protein ImpH
MAGEGGGPTTDLGDSAGPAGDQAVFAKAEAVGPAGGAEVPSDQAPPPEALEPIPDHDARVGEGEPPGEPQPDSGSAGASPSRTEPRAPEPPVQPPAGRPTTLHRHSLSRRLFEESHNFDFFQAVRLLQRMEPGRVRVGRGGPPQSEAVRFRARTSLSFPPSSIYEIKRPTSNVPVPIMVQAFMGLTGPSGVLPRHYTELLYKIEREFRTAEKYALRDWFDLFNHRLVSLFYLAWEKYRFYVPFERGEHRGPEPDPFTNCVYSLIGLGARPFRGRLSVTARDTVDEYGDQEERVLARIEDLVLLHFSGTLGHRPRCAVALEAMLEDFFQVPVWIDQFEGQWLPLEPSSRTRLSGDGGNNQLGVSAVAGDRVWDRQSKFRARLGPMGYSQFTEFLPDRDPVPERKTFVLLVQLIRLYAEPTLDFDVQLVLKAEEVPACQLTGEGTFGARLGWNTWLLTQPMIVDAEDVVLEGEEPILGPKRLSG